MPSLPATDLRSNCGTWAVPEKCLPCLAHQMVHALPTEAFDPNFQGQWLETIYFDTHRFALRKARVKGDHYLTLRIRCYQGEPETYALSAKTESQKFRVELQPEIVPSILQGGPVSVGGLLPPDLLARLQELAGDDPLLGVVKVCFTRYAVENPTDRLTLDVGIQTDTGKCYPTHVLEYKSTSPGNSPPLALSLRPIKLSKFLWATC